MSVTGYLALYTTLIGWQQYHNLWNVMVGTGLVYLPFIGIIMDSFLQPFESQEPKSASVIALRRLMLRIVGALLVIEFCCVPTIPLNPKVLHYEPACSISSKVATPGHTGTTYDNQFKAITGVKVPVLWYLVMAISNGFTHAAIQGLSCQPINYRRLQSQLDVTRITDLNLRKETVDFYNACYVPAYSHYVSDELSDFQKSQITNYQKEYGKDDIGWIGSAILRDISGFYDSLYAQKPVEGFLFDPVRDQFDAQVPNHSQWGRPTCQDWWSNPEHGLYKRLLNNLPANFLITIVHLMEDPNKLGAIGLRQLIKHSFDPGMTFGEISRGYESLDDDIHGNWFSSYVGATIGVGMERLHYYPKLSLLINALPVIQALLLMVIYMLIAVFIPFSSYRLHFVITGAAIIFAITFWSYLWHLVLYLDNTLLPALYPQGNAVTGLATFLNDGGGMNKVFVDFIIGTLYIALPLLFLILMSWAGFKVSNAFMAAISEMKAPGNAAGKQAGAMAQRGLNMTIGAAKTAITKVPPA